MLFKKRNKTNAFAEDTANMPYPSADAVDGQVYRSFVLMRIMLIVVNTASLIFCRSFMQSWNDMHGSSPIWIPLIFSLIPLGSLVFIYLFMGKIGSERILKLICIILCGLHIACIFLPQTEPDGLNEIQTAQDNSLLRQVQNELGMSLPDGTAVSIDDTIIILENPDDSFSDKLKRYAKGEKLYSCIDLAVDREQVADFEKSLENSPVWLKKIPEKLNGLPFSALSTSGYDYFLFFDCGGKVFNSVPDGKTEIYQLMYNSQGQTLRILKYQKVF